jgi:3'(2'), 5'-bisphosphate nucleotidase
VPDGALIDAAVRAVSEAGAVCRHVQQGQDSIRALTKDDRSPVTVADFASQAVVARRLGEALGPVRLLAEENADALRHPDQAAALERVVEAARVAWPEADAEAVLEAIDAGNDDATADTFWTLDPIDGTKGFLRGEQYAVSLALVENGRPVVGALGCPNLSASFDAPLNRADAEGRIYLAVRGAGVHHGSMAARTAGDLDAMTRPGRSGSAIRVAESVEAAHSKHDAVTKVLGAVGGGTESLRLDSQAKYAVVARGQADAYLRMPTRKGYIERIWDHAAGSLVATEAGCVVTDIAGRELDFGQGAGLERNRGIVCADRGLHDRLIEAIRDLGDALGLPEGVGPM